VRRRKASTMLQTRRPRRTARQAVEGSVVVALPSIKAFD
jgi:hypothetical protein